jgi:TusA-related sulfurtransferase
MAEQVDARGLSCPQPVVITKNRMDKIGSGVIEVMVDTATARDNITRLAENQGWRVEIKETGDEYLLTITKKQ